MSTISFTKKPVYTCNGRDYDTLEEAQLAAIGDLDVAFAPSSDDSGKTIPDEICHVILANADKLTAIFRQTPRKNASPQKRKSRKAATETKTA